MTSKLYKLCIKPLLVLPLFVFSLSAQAGMMTMTLGNGASGLTDGDMTTTLGLLGVQGGQDAPFDQGYGHALLGPAFSGLWTFNYAAIAETILSATITIGIADHDSQASGDQVGLYSLDGNDMTAQLNTAFEASGGADTEFNVYTLDLGAANFINLADGTVFVNLELQGAGLVSNLLFGTTEESSFNPANLIFSTLEIVFEDSTQPPNPVPEPSTLILFSLSLLMFGRRIFN